MWHWVWKKKHNYFKNNLQKSYNPRTCAKIVIFSAFNDFNNTLKFNQHVQSLFGLWNFLKKENVNSKTAENMTIEKIKFSLRH